MKIAHIESPGLAALAPMAGATDLPFRVLMRDLGAAFVTTELVSATGIVRGGHGSLRLIALAPEERPVGVQLFGGDPAELAEAAAKVVELVAPDLIDLNMGCPVPKVVTLGAGAALMRDPRKVERLVAAVAARVAVPVTAKIRAGWDDTQINAPDVAAAIEAGGGRAVAVHARTRAQRHAGTVDLPLLGEVKRRVRIPVLGNGGIKTPADALRMVEQTGCDGVLVGRGAIDHPWIFRDIEDARRGAAPRPPSAAERLAFVRRHLELAHRYRRDENEAETLRVMRPQLLRYTAGLPAAVELRRGIDRIATFADCLAAFERLLERAYSRRASGSPHSANDASAMSAPSSVSA